MKFHKLFQIFDLLRCRRGLFFHFILQRIWSKRLRCSCLIHFLHLFKNLLRFHHIIQCTVCMNTLDPKIAAQTCKVFFLFLWQKFSCQFQGIYCIPLKSTLVIHRPLLQKTVVKNHILSHQNILSDEIKKCGKRCIRLFSLRSHLICNACKRNYLFRQLPFWIDDLRKSSRHDISAHPCSSSLQNAVCLCVQPCHFQVDHHIIS